MTQRTSPRRTFPLALVLGIGLLSLAACKREPSPSAAAGPAGDGESPVPAETAEAPAAASGQAERLLARIDAEYRAIYPELTSSQWLSSTYINEDSQRLASLANERYLAKLKDWITEARDYDGQPMSAETARALTLLKLGTAMPPPKDPAALAELTRIAAKMEGDYGAGKYCKGEGAQRRCQTLGELEQTLRDSRDYATQLDAWTGWHGVAAPMRNDYTRFVTLVNDGARNLGYADAGQMWRSGYDMPADRIAAETDRLWQQVKPLYQQLHCYARGKLNAKYGQGKGETAGRMLPAHLLGNMWQQDWGNLWDILQPYPNASQLDIDASLQRQYKEAHAAQIVNRSGPPGNIHDEDAERAARLEIARKMTARAEDFYTSLGLPKLPEGYWRKSQFIKPRDRDVVCHASAWEMNLGGNPDKGVEHDVRTKMCIEPNEEDFTTIYHELGHVYYYLAYAKQPPLFQSGAHDGFHEAIGDTIVLAMTPKYLQSIGLVGAQTQDHDALINAQMRMALAKVAFLPFGLMIDRWRWGVFDGSIAPSQYNKAWWALKAEYQGVAPVEARGETFFDPGAKYHVPGNTPYTRYFLSHVLQFQFYQALCKAAGHTGPLHECSFYGSKAAGEKFQAMLSKGASQPWQKTMQELTGTETMDASALLEYFSPLQEWLQQQNAGQHCGWTADPTATPAAASPSTGPS